jgi:hypothetical protein
MKTTLSPTRLVWLLGLFALPIGAAGTLAWMQHREAEALRVSAAALAAENARLKSELVSLDRRRSELQREFSDAQTKRTAAEAALTPELRRRQAVRAVAAALREKTPGEVSTRVQPRLNSPSGSHGNVYFPELFADPHYAQVYMAWSRQRIAERFAALFAQI